jgi:hypothetical protein
MILRVNELLSQTIDVIIPKNDDFQTACSSIANIVAKNLQSDDQNTILDHPEFSSQVKHLSERANVLLIGKFPFSKIEEKLIEEALTVTGKWKLSTSQDVLAKLLSVHIRNSTMVHGSFEWTEIEKIIDSMDSQELRRFLISQHFNCSKLNHPLCAYRFLILLEMAFKTNLNLPAYNEYLSLAPQNSNENWGFQFAKKKIIDHLALNSTPTLPMSRILELLFSYDSDSVDGFLLEYFNFPILIGWCMPYLLSTPFHQWPNKKNVIGNLLKIISNKSEWGKSFDQAFTDSTTKEIGRWIATIFDYSKPPRERLDCLQRFKEFFSHLNYHDYLKIFTNQMRNFNQRILLENNKITDLMEIDPYLGQLIDLPNVIISLSGDLLPINYNILTAYEKGTGSVLWELKFDDLGGDKYEAIMSPYGIVLFRSNSQEILIINPTDGAIVNKVEMPVKIPRNQATFDITPSGFCFIRIKNTLRGGRIIDSEWKEEFSFDTNLSPTSECNLACKYHGCFTQFRVSGEFVFSNSYHKEGFFTVFDQRGNSFRISNNILDIKHCNGQFYLHEKSDTEKNLQWICMKKFEDGHFTDNIGERLVIADGKIDFFDVCDDGTVVIYVKNKEVIFANLLNNEQVKVPLKESCLIQLDRTDKIVWTINSKKVVSRHSPTSSVKLNKLNIGDDSSAHTYSAHTYFDMEIRKAVKINPDFVFNFMFKLVERHLATLKRLKVDVS